ncbi:MAG: hypothetical protein KI791_07225 [Cyclobacteriaceae bacterium]|nr:hypothetical protein [Cyclobacteriaceae bacterium SS2]
MRNSRIITLLLLLMLFSFISEIEDKLKEKVSTWTLRYTEQLELGFKFTPLDLSSDSLFFSVLK